MMGNGIHLAAVAAWHFYIFAHVIRKDVVARLRVPLSCTPHMPTVELSSDAEETTDDDVCLGPEAKRHIYFVDTL